MELTTCEMCSEHNGDITCSCGCKFCEPCFTNLHLRRHPEHRAGGNTKSQAFWNWATDRWANFSDALVRATLFKADEAAKWFGLQTDRLENGRSITSIAETDRLRNLMEISLHFESQSPNRQFPSLTSFVGDTGAGKSTLIRALIFHSEKANKFDPLEAPVAGAQSGSSALISTTGEVNLYLDPNTFGSESPIFYADCEGMLGSSNPVASQHQTQWMHRSERYLVETEDGKPVDRSTAAKTLYPRFLYMFSDVVCYVTRSTRAWPDSAIRLLNWSMTGAQGNINQHSLPALIIILNGPTVENEAWVSDDYEAVTKDFFKAVDSEIDANAKIRELAEKHGDKSMRGLFNRSFSSVHVHYIPLHGFCILGTSLTIMQQTARLAQRIRVDSARVQSRRAAAWTRFDTRQLSLVVEYAFRHLGSRTTEPFDFSSLRQQLLIPQTAEANISEFLGHCLKGGVEERFERTAAVLGSCILRQSLYARDNDMWLVPSSFVNEDMQGICNRAITDFLDHNLQCAFVDPDSSERCVNTKFGHAIGHQSEAGSLLNPGLFVHGAFDSARFVSAVQGSIDRTMKHINAKNPASRQEWRRFAAERQRVRLASLRQLGGYPDHLSSKLSVLGSTRRRDVSHTSVCYGCLFGRPEYALPCGHVLCLPCLEDFDRTDPSARYPGVFVHKECIICAASTGEGWPYKAQVRPDLAGLRVLSLDGGGVRGIIELKLLERLETQIGLGLPIGSFFDFIMGTSAGTSNPGGIIALGIGIQGRDASSCTSLYRDICRDGFKPKTGTKAPVVGWVARWCRGSIYKTSAMESALNTAFIGKTPKTVYGMSNQVRVAITTTVREQGGLIANYNRGGSGRYLNSELPLWKAARCTSAAPMYFEPRTHAGFTCRDGGLTDNNPLQLAVNECKKIWQNNVEFDVIISIGSGRASAEQKKPESWKVLPNWLRELFQTLISTMNGENAWQRFIRDQEPRIKNRASRMNVVFASDVEPALDAFSKVDSMERLANTFLFRGSSVGGDFAPIVGECKLTLVGQLADRLRASMYFFQLGSITKHNGIYAVTGWIGCRLGPGEEALLALIRRTNFFQVKSTHYPLLARAGDSAFRLDVDFNQQDVDAAIRIDVSFAGAAHLVSISGFPLTLRVSLPSRSACPVPSCRPIAFSGLTRCHRLSVHTGTSAGTTSPL
ncbi:hypothetical protein C8A05DRAFT_17128 [Staphylotrichum tortipilum]|uniref:PNPLA domain-containing protein n=1 Tax=Staphylotrichum tortipilum TaxID=2831512 RepID=A0AAN6MH38_9PEZI|nr:hypothetical protein C8A05DRAFT_17128 [Staphylotrichum longicolle]